MIRQAKVADYPLLAALWLKSSLAAHDFVAAEYWQKMENSVRRDYLPNAETFVFEDKHQIKGFISIMDHNHIGALFVAPVWQKQRIGSKLLNYIRRRRPHLTLKVFVKNQTALQFYRKHGFKLIAEQVDVSTQEAELLMSWAVGCISGFQKRYRGDS